MVGFRNGSDSDIAGHLDREAARLPHAALDVLGALAEVAVAGADVAPGVEDRDHRLARVVGALVAHLPAVRERWPNDAQVRRAVPAVAAQIPPASGPSGSTVARSGGHGRRSASAPAPRRRRPSVAPIGARGSRLRMADRKHRHDTNRPVRLRTDRHGARGVGDGEPARRARLGVRPDGGPGEGARRPARRAGHGGRRHRARRRRRRRRDHRVADEHPRRSRGRGRPGGQGRVVREADRPRHRAGRRVLGGDRAPVPRRHGGVQPPLRPVVPGGPRPDPGGRRSAGWSTWRSPAATPSRRPRATSPAPAACSAT